MSRYLAIDLDPEGLFVVAGTARGTVRVEQALSWLPGSDDAGPPPLTAENARAIGEQLRERLRAAGVSAAPAVVAVGRDKVILKELRYPAVAPTEEPALVRFQALKEITEAPDEVVLDYAPLANGAPDGERRSLAVILRKEVFAAIQAVCAAAGLKLAGVTPRPFAVAAGLARAFAARTVTPPDTPDEAVAVVTVGPAGGEFTVIRHGEVAFTRAIPAPVVASEPLLIGQVRRDLAVYAGQAPGHPVQSVYVADASLAGWVARLRTAIGIPVHHYDPLEGVAPDIAPQTRGRFAGAAGLLAGRASDTLPINFASPRQPKAEANPVKKKLLLGALAALLVIAVGGGFGFLELKAAEDRVANLQTRKADLQKSITDLEPAAKQLAAVEQWQSREVVFLDEMYDMTDRFPSGEKLNLTQLSMTAIPPDKTGKQDAQATIKMAIEAKESQAVDALVTAIQQDTRGKKFYTATKGNAVQDVFNIETRVYRRPPSEYTRFKNYPTPPRKLFPATPKTDSTTKKVEPIPDPDTQ